MFGIFYAFKTMNVRKALTLTNMIYNSRYLSISAAPLKYDAEKCCIIKGRHFFSRTYLAGPTPRFNMSIRRFRPIHAVMPCLSFLDSTRVAT